MNRIIKFRAWPINGIKNISRMQDNVDCMRLLYNKACDVIDVSSSYIFMQFTGLLDENGVEIYEGDVLELIVVGEKTTGNVIFENGSFWIKGLDFNKILFLYNNKCKVIGHIYT